MKQVMKKMATLLMISAILGIAFSGCTKAATTPIVESDPASVTESDSSSAADDYKLVLRLSHVFDPDEQLTKSMDIIADNILERTNGAIEIQTFPSGQIATYKDGVEQVVRGANFISVEDPSYIGDYVPEFTALVGPMLFHNYDEYVELVRTDMVEGWKMKAEEKGIKILALDFIFGFRSVITDKTITKPEDLRGMKIRTPGSQLFIETLNAMGATAVPLPWGETFSALEQGVVDGLEGSEFTNAQTKVYETGKKNVALTNHFLGTCGFYISVDVWNNIPEEYRVIIEEEVEREAERSIALLKAEYEETVKELEANGVVFNEVDVEAFTEATKGLFETLPGVNIEMYNQIQDELKKIRN